MCNKRGDEWSFKVKGKIEYFAEDLHAADVFYHRQCSVNFRTGRRIPVQFSEHTKKKAGRPENTVQQNAFIKTCDYFQNHDEEQFTISDLIEKMNEFLKDTEQSAYDRRHMKRKLEDFYGENIISGGNGRPVVVTYCQTANSILQDYLKITMIWNCKRYS